MSNIFSQLNKSANADAKDYVIERAISGYTDCIIPPRPSAEVEYALSQNRLSRARARRKRFGRFAAVAAVLLVMILGINGIAQYLGGLTNSGSAPEPSVYSVYSLSRRVATTDELKKSDVIAEFMDDDDADVRNGKIFYSSHRSEPSVISADIVVLSNAGLVQITVVVDLKRGLTDYGKYYTAEDEFSFDTVFKNGEFYSTGYASRSDGDYYVSITSPQNIAPQLYFG